MKKIIIGILLAVATLDAQEKTSCVTVHLENQEQEKMKLLIGLIDFPASMHDFVERLQNNLRCDQQKSSGFAAEMREFNRVPSRTVLKKIAQEGFSLIVFLKVRDEKLEWRLYDTFQAVMQTGKRVPLRDDRALQADYVSDQLWELLTGQEGIFSTRIAYCVEKQEGGHKGTNIYIKKPYEATQNCLVTGGKLLAPRWNKNKKNSQVLFSEVTPSNIRLMSSSLQGKRKLIANFEGLTMLPSFSRDNQHVVYCSTYNGTSQLYSCSIDKERNKKVTQRITHNNGNNTSPNLCDNGDIIFCSDFETKVPQIYYWHNQQNSLERLTKSGYCASPNYCEKNKKIVYCSLVGNTMQLFEYDVEKKQHAQLTSNSGNKDECCWSPCGNYVTFSVDDNKSSRIALLNTITQEQTFITAPNQQCAYPSWSLGLRS